MQIAHTNRNFILLPYSSNFCAFTIATDTSAAHCPGSCRSFAQPHHSTMPPAGESRKNAWRHQCQKVVGSESKQHIIIIVTIKIQTTVMRPVRLNGARVLGVVCVCGTASDLLQSIQRIWSIWTIWQMLRNDVLDVPVVDMEQFLCMLCGSKFSQSEFMVYLLVTQLPGIISIIKFHGTIHKLPLAVWQLVEILTAGQFYHSALRPATVKGLNLLI